VPAKETLAALGELESVGWRVRLTSGRAHAYAKAYCPGGPGGCAPVMVYGTPRVPEAEAARIRGALRRCPHLGGQKP
jgi:hypothetical protein